MRKPRRFGLVRRALPVAAALFFLASPPAWSEPARDERLDPLLQVRSMQLTGRSRVIVEFRGDPDARVITRHRGVTGRQLTASRAQVAEIDNTVLSALADDPQ